ncbi:MAG: non-canonical purine NTP pyrophosphatase [Phycisphaerales bacterium]|nr:MAG: non-canonical purine NTP pyrophosphatase [Phycisphaerales bacterium]
MPDTHADHPAFPLVLATANPHKVAEFRAILTDLPILGLADLDPPPGGFREPDETGDTFEANATIKALSYAEQTGRWCLADDSGLEVDALAGAPGVISSHYFNDGRTDGEAEGMSRDERDQRNNAKLLRELDGVPLEQRDARFVCVIALAAPPSDGAPARLVRTVRGSFEGRIGLPGDVPRGEHGFGYDPIFLVKPELTQTSAELSPGRKNTLSHRAAAAARLREQLQATP